MTPLQRLSLSKRSKWCVHSTHPQTITTIKAHLFMQGLMSGSCQNIPSRGEVLNVYMMPFSSIEFLTSNKEKFGLFFRVFSQRNEHVPWCLWRGIQTIHPEDYIKKLGRTKHIRGVL